MVLHIILIVAVGWIALSVLVLPVVMLIGRAGHQADIDAAHQHREILAAESPATIVPARSARASHA